MLSRELIRAEVNAGEFLKSILNVGETKQNTVEVAGYKPPTFVKRNFSQVIFEDF